MALWLDGSTQYVTQALPPVLDYPFCVGISFNLAAAANSTRAVFSLSDTGSLTNYLQFRMSTTEIMRSVAEDGTGETAGAATTALVAGQWNFTLLRLLSANDRRFRPLYGNGFSGENGSSAISRTPTGLDTITLGALQTSGGASQFWHGGIGEYWILDGDVWPTGGDAGNDFMRALRLLGPFGIPHIARRILEYRSFRTSINGGGPGNVYFGSKGMPGAWVETGGVTIGPHPPLPYWYAKPSQTKQQLVI